MWGLICILVSYIITHMEDQAKKQSGPEEGASENNKTPGKFFNPKKGLDTMLRKARKIVRCLKTRGKIASSYMPIMLAVIREMIDALCLPTSN